MKKLQTIKKLETKLKELYDISRNYDYSQIACVNVKRYTDYIDIDKVIDEYTKKEKLRVKLKELFTEDFLSDEYYHWIEMEAHYFLDEYIKEQCSNNSEKWWHEQIEKAETEIDKKKQRKMMIKDLKEKNMLEIVNNLGCGFYGRSGGWFGVKVKDLVALIENLLYELRDSNLSIKQVEENYNIDDVFKQIKAVFYVLDKADKFNKSMSWKEQILFLIEENENALKLEILKEKQIKIAKKYAELNGYFLAKKI